MATLCGENFQTVRHSQDERLYTHALYQQLYPKICYTVAEKKSFKKYFLDTLKIADLGQSLDS